MEDTLVLIKPDAVARDLVGQIIARFEGRGLKLVELDLLVKGAPVDVFKHHYGEHREKCFYDALCERMADKPLVALVLRGIGAVALVRKIIGATDPLKAEAGTIRGDFGLSYEFNSVHASDAVESAKREIALWFPKQ